MTGAPECAGCPHLQSCEYSRVFETPVDPAQLAVLRGPSHAPHPFVMTPPLEAKGTARPGAELQVHVTLIGSGVEHLPYFVAAFEELGRNGRFGGQFRLAAVTAAHRPGHVVYDGRLRRIMGLPLAATPGESDRGARRIRLRFITPLRLRTRGRYNGSPNFAEITGGLLRRIHFLSALYGDGPPSMGWLNPLLAEADRVRTEESRFELFRWDRFSGRQQRRVAMDGIAGWLEASGEMDGVLPYLRLGEHLHVGSGTSMGMGRYQMEVLQENSDA